MEPRIQARRMDRAASEVDTLDGGSDPPMIRLFAVENSSSVKAPLRRSCASSRSSAVTRAEEPSAAISLEL